MLLRWRYYIMLSSSEQPVMLTFRRNYRPQFAKVMFLQVSVCPQGEYLGRYPHPLPWAGTPQTGTPPTPWVGTPPLGRYIPLAGTPPSPWGGTPPPWAGTPPGRYNPPGRHTPHGWYPLPGTPLGQVHPQAGTPPRQVHPPRAVHAGRYGQQAGGRHPTGMNSCFFLNFSKF